VDHFIHGVTGRTWGTLGWIDHHMTGDELAEFLQRLGLSQAALARLLDDLGERQPAPTTVWRWVDGRSRVPVGVGALLRLLEQMPDDQRIQLTRRALRV
jgi:hypothetical protein